MRAPVAAPAFLGALFAQRALLAVTDDRHPVGADTAGGEVVGGGLRATLAETEVVLGGAALVAMAFDEEDRGRVCLEPRRVPIEGGALLAPDVVAVEIEPDILQVRSGGVVAELGPRAGRVLGGRAARRRRARPGHRRSGR